MTNSSNIIELSLSSKEALKKLSENGKNKLVEAKKASLISLFFKQLINPMIIVLLISSLLSVLINIYQQNYNYSDVVIILIVVILNGILGTIQERKAENAIEALKKITSSTSKVIRDKNIATILSEEIVVDDIIYLEAGDSIPADAIILENHSLQVDESTLTGESIPVNKDIDKNNQIYMGSTVTYGRCYAKVVKAGMATKIGSIANVLTKAKDIETPLQKKLSHLSKILSFLVVAICVIMFILNLIIKKNFSVSFILDTFILAISLAVAAIPEGLAAVVTILLSIGVTKMAKQNAVIRKLTAVETLGSTSVICSDKTGTLTQNKMVVTKTFTNDYFLLSKTCLLCNNAILQNNDWFGDPTEIAIAKYASTSFPTLISIKESEKQVMEVPFDSTRKMMSVIYQKDSLYHQYTKGALDKVLQKCNRFISSKGITPLTKAIKEQILSKNNEFASDALRVISCAYKDYWYSPSSLSNDKIENDLIFVGIVGMTDPVRPEVIGAIKECQKASIIPIMITGDHKATAISIAKQLNIIHDETEAITGDELNQLTDIELQNRLDKYHVYARVNPEHKVRIVQAWQGKGKIVAMTGDGVNDAPSIKMADIGIGMGITGTDVTKNVADMILADDNFATIVEAVKEGRKIYENIQKAIQFLLSSNLSEVLSILLATILGFTILDPGHILWINLITDTFPALALGMDKTDENIMNQAPRQGTGKFFNRNDWLNIVYQGIVVSILTITSFLIGCYIDYHSIITLDSPTGKTMAFLTMSMAEIFHAFNLRSRKHSIFKIKSGNKYLWLASLFAIFLTTLVIYFPPLNKLFGFSYISYFEYAISIGLAIMIIPIVETVKKIFFRKQKS